MLSQEEFIGFYVVDIIPGLDDFRDFQMEVEEQKMEAYQSATEEADRLVMAGCPLPPYEGTYEDLPDFDFPPSYYDFDHVCTPLDVCPPGGS